MNSCIELKQGIPYACMSALSTPQSKLFFKPNGLPLKKRLATYHVPNDQIVCTFYNEAKASNYRLRTSRGINKGAQTDWLQCIGDENCKSSIKELKPGLQHQTRQSNHPPSCSSHAHYSNVCSTSWFGDVHHDSPTEGRCRHQNRETTQAGTTSCPPHQSNR